MDLRAHKSGGRMFLCELYERRNRIGKNGRVIIQNEDVICSVFDANRIPTLLPAAKPRFLWVSMITSCG